VNLKTRYVITHVVVLTAAPAMLAGCRVGDLARGAASAAAPVGRSRTELVETYVQAVNEKNAARLRGLIHPKCFALTDGNRQSLLDDRLAREFDNAIPDEYSVRWTVIAPDDRLPGERSLSFGVRPSHSVHISFQRGANRRVGIRRYVVADASGWWLVVPVPIGL